MNPSARKIMKSRNQNIEHGIERKSETSDGIFCNKTQSGKNIEANSLSIFSTFILVLSLPSAYHFNLLVITVSGGDIS